MGFGIALGMLLLFATVAVVLILAIGFATSTLTWPFADRGMRFEGCFLHATLRSPTDPGVAIDLANAPVEAGPEVTGARSVAVPAGRYNVHTESGCTWSIRLAHP
jgi:NhaP-type Na+/H+ or K+/H+ antiporter